jgi:2-oxoacid:acceptor oxidoreductase delta subunit (pyruvate/2-ketoisovalerate family)
MATVANKLPGWKDLPEGGLIEKPGTSVAYKTGDWRSERPIWSAEKCIDCKICWMYCPDASIKLNAEGKVDGIDYEHCKGCGICAEECPKKVNAITMHPESEFHGE